MYFRQPRTIRLRRLPENLRSRRIMRCCLYFFPQKERRETPSCFSYPSATSSAIIRLKPTAKSKTPILECSPADISGISSSTTT